MISEKNLKKLERLSVKDERKLKKLKRELSQPEFDSIEDLAIDLLKSLTEGQRLFVFDAFCCECGGVQPTKRSKRCNCWNDE